jgi:hypothetical protein
MTFHGPVDVNQYYFFVINNANSAANAQVAPGPIPVLGPPYGNGFATGSNSSTAGFTDFVEFGGGNNGYTMYHVVGNPPDPNITTDLKAEARPVTAIVPDPNDPNTANQLEFEIDLSQLIYDANGVPLVNQSQTLSEARAIRYLQVNIIATNSVPVNTTTSGKQVDSMGDTTDPTFQTSFLLLDLNQAGTVSSNSTTPGTILYESTGDVYPPGSSSSNPSIDLVSWSITPVTQ